jgi:transcription factor MYB, plant
LRISSFLRTIQFSSKFKMTVVEAGEVLNLKVGENPLLEGEAKTGYVSPDDQDGETASEKPCGAPQLKKGPWSPDEDKLLKNYVEAHGEGKWNKVQRNSGLNRCGKSCRLRWTNHLRPDLKKGPFDNEEIDKILKFYLKWGPKWAKIASRVSAALAVLLQFRAYFLHASWV